jgi:protein-disulfide isomerase-like protein with CxxC motif
MASVPVDERTKAMLGALQQRIERETGRDVTQRDVLERVVEQGFESPQAVVDSFQSDPEPTDDDFEGLSDEEIEQWLSGTSGSGDPIEEDEIDRVLYEEEAAPDFASE